MTKRAKARTVVETVPAGAVFWQGSPGIGPWSGDSVYLFYSNADWGSQWHPCSFSHDGEEYNCAEQWMMAEKARIFGDVEAREYHLLEERRST